MEKHLQRRAKESGAYAWAVARVYTCCLACKATGLILPSLRRSWMALRANEPFNRKRSAKIDVVIILYFGTSANILSYVGWSKSTKAFTFSFVFPLDHFFFLPLPPAMAARAFSSFDFWIFGGMVTRFLHRRSTPTTNTAH